MEHNLFKFTIRCKIDEDRQIKPTVLKYLEYITENLNHDAAALADVYTICYDPKSLSYIKLITHDYGVIQVGVGIINMWMMKLFTGPQEWGVVIEAIVAHPINDLVSGALIQWDWENGYPIIHELGL